MSRVLGRKGIKSCSGFMIMDMIIYTDYFYPQPPAKPSIPFA